MIINTEADQYFIPRLLPSFLSHTVGDKSWGGAQEGGYIKLDINGNLLGHFPSTHAGHMHVACYTVSVVVEQFIHLYTYVCVTVREE